MLTHTPAIADLTPLIGTWRMDAVFPDGRQGSPEDSGARTVFEHGPDAAFVIQRSASGHAGVVKMGRQASAVSYLR